MDRAHTEPVPERIGDYRILEPLGRGGMAVVYRGVHLQSGEAAAIKTVHGPSGERLQGLRREIRALARLQHPGIVRILAEGVHEGLPWMAMELLEGVPLDRWCHSLAKSGSGPSSQEQPAETGAPEMGSTVVRRPASPEAASRPARTAPPVGAEKRRAAAGGHLEAVLDVVLRLCAPLAYLHGEGLVHRDLKPQNVLLTEERGTRNEERAGASLAPRSSFLVPVLIDFGLMAQFGGVLSREVLEVSGQMVGTVPYMAPEQIRGELVDARADLYSLGCILFELLTGRRPFQGRERRHVLEQHLKTRPPRPSELVEGVPEELEDLVLRLLHKEPRQRPGHAGDVAAVLARLGAGAEVQGPAPATRSYLYRPGFAGRPAALEELRGALAQLGEGRGGLVLVGGESGAGKTRLVMELGREAAQLKVQVLAGECLDLGARALEGLRRPLQSVADRCREHGPAETAQLLGRRGKVLAAYEPELRCLPGLEAFPEPAELPPDAARLRLYSDLLETFDALAAEAPVLLVLDDLQWADDLLLGFLEHLVHIEFAGTRRAVPLTVVGTYRSEDVGAHESAPLQRLIGHQRCSNVVLGRMDEASVLAMVGDMLALSPAPRVLSQVLARHSEGNPFFVAEYLRAAVEEGLLWRNEMGAWQVETPGDEAATEQDYERMPLPRSLRGVVERRLQGLPEGALSLISAAAVLGREMDTPQLARMTGLDEEELWEPVSELRRRHVLEEPSAGRLRFTHDKLRERAYERLGAEARRHLHRAAAQALGDAATHASLGHHWEAAGESALARQAYRSGARQAYVHSLDAEAVRLYRCYLRLAETPTGESIAVRNELAEALTRSQGASAEAFREQELALAEARELEDLTEESRGLLGLAALYIDSSRLDEARALLEQVLQMSRKSGSLQDEISALRRIAVIERRQGRFEQCLERFQQTYAKLQPDDLIQQHLLLNEMAMLHGMQGRLDLARPLLEKGIVLCRSLGQQRNEAVFLSNLATLHDTQGRPTDALQLYSQALRLSCDCGNRRSEMSIRLNLAVLHASQGDVAQAREGFRQALAIGRTIGIRWFQGAALAFRGGLERRQGEPAEAGRYLHEAEKMLRLDVNALYLGMCLCEMGHLALAEGRHAEPFLQEASELAARLGVGPDSELAKTLSRLRRALEAQAAGRPLLHGECPEDLPPALRLGAAIKTRKSP